MHRFVFGFLGLSMSLLAAACAPELTASGGAGGTGGTGGGGGTGGTGGAPECTTADDCPENECRTGGACQAATCKWQSVTMPGAPVGAQVYGDCKQRECDASGAITQAASLADVYAWGNACFKDACEAWLNPQPDPGRVCMTKWTRPGLCDQSLRCVECTSDSDCAESVCAMPMGKCIPDHCMNGVLDAPAFETDLDCGGPCLPCAPGQKCVQRVDCEGEGTCQGSPKVCMAPTCNDLIKNGDETGPDCGGSCAQDMASPKKCGDGQGCLFPDDCQAGLSCKSGTCQP
ncbi:hypothetical protein [Polyangium sp. y55x31]|uniref:hypothetical protein n=1 Tax=Polyangium sp. y55x31 TaxID=3042688 RepID=UPI0024828B0E|nr:hypothetical protein [Polyangium sp. y55x31]MDI1481666.1 hypothetical protein [Polyangium sp. y55x31]